MRTNSQNVDFFPQHNEIKSRQQIIPKGGGNMKKNYNYWVTSQNTPQFKSKRILHILSSTCLVINLIVFAILLPEIRLWTLGIAFVFTAYLFLQLFDKRKDQWAWWIIIFGIVLSIAVSVCYALLFDLYLYLIVIAAEIIISTVVFCILKRKWYVIGNRLSSKPYCKPQKISFS